jgi:hypothetical protein
MKNIHLITTSQPSRLIKNNHSQLLLTIQTLPLDRELGCLPQHIYITNDEEIKDGDWLLIIDDFETYIHKHKGDNLPTTYYKKIIITTDQDLINEGVQAIDDEFLGWFVKNPTCEEVDVIYDKDTFPYGVETAKGYGWYKIIIPREEPKQPTTFKELFANTGIEPTTDENGNIQYNFKATMKEEPKQNCVNCNQLISKYGCACGKQEEHPKQIKCYCGHTSYCDCSPLEEPKQEENEIIDISDHDGIGNAVDNLNNEPPQETTLEEIRKYAELSYYNGDEINAFVNGAKWQADRMYSEEDLRNAYRWGTSVNHGTKEHFNEWLEQYKKK